MQINQFIQIMQYMAGSDSDRAKNRNDVGFNATDSHSIIGNIAHAMLVNPAWFTSKSIEEQTLLMKVCIPELVKYKSTQLSHLWDESWVVEYPDVAPRHVGELAQEAKSIRENVITIKPHDGKIAIQIEGNYKYITPAIKGVDDVYKKKYSLWFDYGKSNYWLIKDTSYTVEQIVEYVKEATKDLQVSIRVENFVFETKEIERYIRIYAYKGMYGVQFINIADFMPLKDGLKDLAVQYNRSLCRWSGEPDLTWQVQDKRVIDDFVASVKEHYGYEIRFEEVDETPQSEIDLKEYDEINARRMAIMENVLNEVSANGVELYPFQKTCVQFAISDTFAKYRKHKKGTLIQSGPGTGKTPMSAAAARIYMEDMQADFALVITNKDNREKYIDWLQKFNIKNFIVTAWSSAMPYIEAWVTVHKPRYKEVTRQAWVMPNGSKSKDIEGWIADKDVFYGATKFRLVVPITKSKEQTSIVHLNNGLQKHMTKIKVDNKEFLIIDLAELCYVHICDEAHKSSNTYGFKAAKQAISAHWLSERSVQNLQVTATPHRNGNAGDGYSLVQRTNLPLGSWREFNNKFSYSHYDGYKGIKNGAELNKLYSSIRFFMQASDMDGMPPKIIRRTDINPDNDEELVPLIRQWRALASEKIAKYKGGKMPITERMALRTAASLIKVKFAVETIIGLLHSGEKVVVYSPFTQTIDAIYNKLQDNLDYVDNNTLEPKTAKIYQITGAISTDKRVKAQKEFQTLENCAAVALISGAGSESIDLNSSRILLLVDFDWSPRAFEQTTGRVYRDGSQRFNSVLIWVLTIAELDEYMYEVVTEKLHNVATFENEGVHTSHGINDAAVQSTSEIAQLIRDSLIKDELDEIALEQE